eukprot:5689361-Prorocentrum_lima.AAC.1
MVMVGMQVSRLDFGVVFPPCAQLSQLARRIRDDSREVGHRMRPSRGDQYVYLRTLHRMGWVSTQAIQEDT